jgi:hypothetical protein
MTERIATAGFHEGLECVLGRHRVALPVDAVVQLIEYDVAPPPPMAQRWVSGIGTYDGRVLISVSLVPSSSPPQRRTTKGVLLRSEGSGVAWALEVARAASFVRAHITTEPLGNSEKVPSWILRASTEDGRPIGWIDVVEMMSRLIAGELLKE